MKYLVDTNIISETTKPEPDPAVVDWLRQHEAKLAIDTVVLGEIRLGILLLPRGKRRAALEKWFGQNVEKWICLPWEAATALKWAELVARLRTEARAMPLKDSMIAASAAAHGLTVATRNLADFEKAGVPVVNPFDHAAE